MYSSIRRKYYWPMLYVDVQNWARTCVDCQTGKTGGTHKAPLKPLTPPASVFEIWHRDHISLSRSKGYKYALVLVDSLSVFSILLSAKTASAEETADLLYHNLL